MYKILLATSTQTFFIFFNFQSFMVVLFLFVSFHTVRTLTTQLFSRRPLSIFHFCRYCSLFRVRHKRFNRNKDENFPTTRSTCTFLDKLSNTILLFPMNKPCNRVSPCNNDNVSFPCSTMLIDDYQDDCLVPACTTVDMSGTNLNIVFGEEGGGWIRVVELFLNSEP